MTFSEWEKGVPDILREDALWTIDRNHQAVANHGSRLME
jgi:hypothetical protein